MLKKRWVLHELCSYTNLLPKIPPIVSWSRAG